MKNVSAAVLVAKICLEDLEPHPLSILLTLKPPQLIGTLFGDHWGIIKEP